MWIIFYLEWTPNFILKATLIACFKQSIFQQIYNNYSFSDIYSEILIEFQICPKKEVAYQVFWGMV